MKPGGPSTGGLFAHQPPTRLQRELPLLKRRSLAAWRQPCIGNYSRQSQVSHERAEKVSVNVQPIYHLPSPIGNSSLPTLRSFPSRCFRNRHENVIRAGPDQIWIGLCHGTEEAIAYFQAFFKGCIENSARKCVVLGPQEFEYKRTLNSGAAVTQTWRDLIEMTDSQVLAIRRT
jgi:hypothetical protein